LQFCLHHLHALEARVFILYEVSLFRSSMSKLGLQINVSSKMDWKVFRVRVRANTAPSRRKSFLTQLFLVQYPTTCGTTDHSSNFSNLTSDHPPSASAAFIQNRRRVPCELTSASPEWPAKRHVKVLEKFAHHAAGFVVVINDMLKHDQSASRLQASV